MVIPQTGEYALRAMGCMAALGQETVVRTKDLSERAGIPVHYLSKIMRRLVAAGLLSSEKGHGGGFRFARAMRRITFADILSATGFELEPNHCAFGFARCNLKSPCLLQPAFSKLNATLRDWAMHTTLQDVADSSPAARFALRR